MTQLQNALAFLRLSLSCSWPILLPKEPHLNHHLAQDFAEIHSTTVVDQPKPLSQSVHLPLCAPAVTRTEPWAQSKFRFPWLWRKQFTALRTRGHVIDNTYHQ